MEKRRVRRIESVNFVSIEVPDEHNQLTSAHMARTLDLSPAGAKVEITSSVPFTIPIGDKLLFTIALGDSVVALRGRIVGKKQKSERQVVLGIEFLNPLPDDRRTISDFLRG